MTEDEIAAGCDDGSIGSAEAGRLWRALDAGNLCPDPGCRRFAGECRPKRPSRRYPPLKRIEEYWGLEHGYCARCNQPARCDRAHIIDRCNGGLDDIQNLAPLCYPCHEAQPSYKPGGEAFAVAWLNTPPDASEQSRFSYEERLGCNIALIAAEARYISHSGECVDWLIRNFPESYAKARAEHPDLFEEYRRMKAGERR